MDYRIISANATIGQIQVTYSNEGEDIATYAIDVPVVDGAFLTGDALAAEIQLRAPVWLLERKAEVSTAIGFDEISALVEPPVVTPPVATLPVEAPFNTQIPFTQSTSVSNAPPVMVL
jgi:hypothetical protein